MTTKQNYVGSRTPEGHEAGSKIETIMTTSIAMSPEKEVREEWEEELYGIMYGKILGRNYKIISFIRQLITSVRQEERAGSYSRRQMDTLATARTNNIMKLYIDDIRNTPNESWTLARTVLAAIRFIAQFSPEEISLDHDISHQVTVGTRSTPFPCDETFESVAWFIVLHYNKHNAPKVTLHTSNPIGAKKMADILKEGGITAEIKPMEACNRLESEV